MGGCSRTEPDWWTQATSLDSRLSGILSYGRSGSIFSETSGAEAVGPGESSSDLEPEPP